MRWQRNERVYEENNEGDPGGCPQSFHLSSRLYLLGVGGGGLQHLRRGEKV